MQIIPVIDLKDGQAVHARLGNRQQYQPIKSSLCKSSDIFDVIDAFLELYPFDTVYIADLNALSKNGNHHILLEKVLNHFSNTTFWIDAGYHQPYKLFSQLNYLPVIGSESCRDSNLSDIKAIDEEFILSLDFSLSQPLGPKKLFENSEFWPKRIIIMTLGLVGSNAGPALAMLQNYCNNYPEKNFIAAGGIRNSTDLLLLKKMGITHTLVASALHSGTISAANIKNIRPNNIIAYD
jgi:phosphoribosylformimino-5-aminoimidazole carboxamide ribotide isomerase